MQDGDWSVGTKFRTWGRVDSHQAAELKVQWLGRLPGLLLFSVVSARARGLPTFISD